MSLEELQEQNEAEQTSAEQVVESTPQPTDAEIEAQEMGWRPKSEWKGADEDFVSAKEFVRRKSFYDRISSQSKELKELRATLDGIKEHHKNLETYTRKQVLEELKGAKKQALIDGDPDKVIEVDEAIVQFKMEEEKAQAEEKAAKAQSSGLHPDFVAWKAKNKWYDSDPDMQEYANTLGAGYKNRRPEVTPDQVLAYVEKEVKARYKDKFENTNRSRAATVESSTAGAGSASKDKVKYDPSDDERRIAKKYVKQGLYASESEFYAELAKISTQ